MTLTETTPLTLLSFPPTTPRKSTLNTGLGKKSGDEAPELRGTRVHLRKRTSSTTSSREILRALCRHTVNNVNNRRTLSGLTLINVIPLPVYNV